MPFDGGDGYRVVCDAFRTAWRPRAPIDIAQWSDAHRRIAAGTGSEPGNWRTDRTPYLRGIMEALAPNHPARIVCFMKSSQVGATDLAINWALWTIDESPTSMGALFPTEKLGLKWARRLNRTIESTPKVRSILPGGRKGDGGNTLLEKSFPDGVLYIGSANTPSDMASISLERELLDEVDRYPREIENEGDPIELFLRRMSTFPRRKAFLNSTPTIESLSRINEFWKISTQHRYYVPCPHCGEKQVLRWEQVRYPTGKPKQADYVCAAHGCIIAEHFKTVMLRGGEWRATFPEREVWGYHINCLYTPIGLGESWGENAQAYERAKHDPSKLKVFTNTRIGETHADPEEKLEWETVYARREAYPMRSVPPGVLVLTAFADVQKDRFEVQLLGWTRRLHAFVLDYTVIYADPTRKEDWAPLDDYFAGSLVNSRGIEMRIAAAGVDAGYLQDDVLAFTRERKSRSIIATKGSGPHGRQVIGRPTLVDVKRRGRLLDKRGAELYVVGASTVKHMVYERIRSDGKVTADGKEMTGPSDRHIHFPEGLEETYFRGVCAEVFDPNKARGWIKVYERNEPLDTLGGNFCVAMHHSLRLHQLSDADWDRLEQIYEPGQQVATPVPEALGVAPIATRGGFLPTSALVKRD